MTNTCQNCQQTFTLGADDLEFYKKMAVPPPTFCHVCRMQRRMSWRNERSLYTSQCAATHKSIITIFAPDSGLTIYDRDYWWSDGWNPFDYGSDYDFKKTFFEQFRELFRHVPQPAVFNNKCVNSNYCNHVGELKDCYLTFASWGGEHLAYCEQEWYCRDSYDLLAVSNSELSSDCINSDHVYNCQWVQNSENCRDSLWLYECRGCSNCIGCVNLRNKSFYIFNEPYSEADYHAKVKALQLDTTAGLAAVHNQFMAIKQQSIHRYASIYNSDNATGDNLQYAHNCTECFGLKDGVSDCKYCVNGGAMTDVYDGYGVGAKADLLYEAVDAGVAGSRIAFVLVVWSSSNMWYSYNCHNCKDCFGCVGLRGAQYCILNKQYSKADYEQLLPQIQQHMMKQPYRDQTGRSYGFGEFFPTELSPFAYNETVAQEYFTLTSNQAKAQGYRWRDQPNSTHIANNRDIKTCAHQAHCNEQCIGVYKILPAEIIYYQSRNLALPQLCPNCRHYDRLRRRNPLRLWQRQCMKCGVTIMTSFVPNRPEIVYCEQCYQKEVY
ncbi:MAG: hypothetical protein HYV33_04995 [Candidatus Kerfeldbacteria bacterium]|nr:hypothetical protein [Candidatus Kerfeldbacteria bacterium]